MGSSSWPNQTSNQLGWLTPALATGREPRFPRDVAAAAVSSLGPSLALDVESES